MITAIKQRLRRLKILKIAVIVFIFCPPAYAQTAEGWIVAKGYFCTLYIKEDVNIADLNRKIDTYRVDYGLTEKPELTGARPEDEVLYKFDVIFLKVQELLDMRPPKIHLDVKIYRTKEEIDRVYVEVYSEEGKFIAFYAFNLNTLYACEEKVSEAVIAHEIAHCVLDHHFAATPPKKIAEMLAHYVELNLKE